MRRFAAHALALAFIALLCGSATAQLANPSFNVNFGAPNDWTLGPTTSAATAFSSAFDMPTHPFFFLQIQTANQSGSIPHSNEGGAGTDAQNTATVSQVFTTSNPFDTLLEWDAQFVSSDATGGDFLEVSITDGVTTYNVQHLDFSDVTTGASPLTVGSADLGALFPNADEDTLFGVILHAGNGGAGTNPSVATFDNFRFSAGTAFEADVLNFLDVGSSQQIMVHTKDPSRRFYNILSGNVSGPLGQGELFGLYLDPLIFAILEVPLGTAGFHFLTNANGDYNAFVPTAAVPMGTTFDYLLVVIDPPTGNVEKITDPKRYVWP